MVTDKLTLSQLFFLTFSFVLSFAAGAGTLSWQETLAGIVLGVLFLSLLRKASKGCGSRAVSLLLSVFFTLSLVFRLWKFGTFAETAAQPLRPAFLYAAVLLVLAVFAASRGLSAVGRFAETSALFLIPAGICLLATALRSYTGDLLFPAQNGTVPDVFSSLLPFSEAAAFLFLLDKTVSKSSESASAPARADAAATAETMPFLTRFAPRFHPVTACLVGGGAAGGLFLFLFALGSDALTREDVFRPVLFLFLLTAAILRVSVLLFAAGRALGTALSCPEGIALCLPAVFSLPLLFLVIYGGNLQFVAAISHFCSVFFPVCGFLVPLFALFVEKLQKVFDKHHKRQ